MTTFKNITGLQVGRLVVRSIYDRGNGVWWICDCACGGSAILKTSRLVGKRNTLSCGCLQREAASRAKTTHGFSRTYLYRTWSQIIQRCTNPNNPAYPDYGGRGITIDDSWRASFLAFRSAVGDRPTTSHTIDRIDNDGPYIPTNIRWATRTEQARNRRSNRFITVAGVTKTLAEWITLSGLHATTIERRLKRGWPAHEAVTRTKDQHVRLSKRK